MNIDFKKIKDAIKLVSLNKPCEIGLIVKNNTLTLCSNGDGFIKKYVKIQNDASEYFKIVLNSETLKLLEKIEGKSCEINVNDFTNIKIDKRIIKINTKVNDFMEYSSLKEIEKNTINATELLRLLSVRYAADKNSVTFLKRIYFNKADVVASDSFRMSIKSNNRLDFQNDFTINYKDIDVLVKLIKETLKQEKNEFNIDIVYCGNYVKFNSEYFTYECEIEKEYFKYKLILKNKGDNNEIKIINKKILIQELKTILSIKSERYIIRLSKDDNNLSISYNDKNISINSVINDTLWKNFNDEIYINGRYLLDSLNNIGADEIILSYRNSKTPLFLTNRNDIDIIMPTKKID